MKNESEKNLEKKVNELKEENNTLLKDLKTERENHVEALCQLNQYETKFKEIAEMMLINTRKGKINK